jgi:hypothetical protein
MESSGMRDGWGCRLSSQKVGKMFWAVFVLESFIYTTSFLSSFFPYRGMGIGADGRVI